MNKIGYKVICNKGGLVSARAVGNLQLHYFVDKWTRPHLTGSKLFAFKDLESAQNFSQPEENIYEAELANPTYARRMAWLREDIRNFWLARIKHKKMPEGTYQLAIDGTLHCDAIKLLRKVA